MRVKAQIKLGLLVTITAFFMLSGIYVIWMGLMSIPCFVISIPFIDLNIMMKYHIFYIIGILIGMTLSFVIDSYIRPILKNI